MRSLFDVIFRCHGIFSDVRTFCFRCPHVLSPDACRWDQVGPGGTRWDQLDGSGAEMGPSAEAPGNAKPPESKAQFEKRLLGGSGLTHYKCGYNPAVSPSSSLTG